MSKKEKILTIITIIVITVLIVFAILYVLFNLKLNSVNKTNNTDTGLNPNLNSVIYNIDDLCKYKLDDCNLDINIDNNGNTIKVNVNKKDSISSITINDDLTIGEDIKPVTSFGLYKSKYFVVVQKDSSIDGNNNIVSYYDKNINLVKNFNRVDSDYEISNDGFNYYTCDNDVYSKYRVNIGSNNFNSFKVSQSEDACN